MSYEAFIAHKLSIVPPTGLQTWPKLVDGLFPHQVALVEWALRRGRAAIFADTGLGKTRMELAWADAIHRQTGVNVLILAPLAVAAQTVREGLEVGVVVTHIREPQDFAPGICIVNYERIQKIDPRLFGAVILDESSIIKHHTSKTLKLLMDAFRSTPFKLCATATPAPNDWTELGTHAEFLGVCTQAEMLAEYFVHDGGETQVWRLKGHARGIFWRFVSSWGAMVRKPSDLGFEDGGYNLPPLEVSEHIAATEAQASEGMLFALEASTLSERRNARRASMTDRVAMCVQQIKSDWYKLAGDSQEIRDVVEAGIRGKQEATRSSQSRTSGEAIAFGEVEPRQESGISEEIHGGVLREASGEIRPKNSRATRALQRKTAGGIQNQSAVAAESFGRYQGVADQESRETTCSKGQEIRDDAAASFGDHESSVSRLCDLRVDGAETQDVPDDRSLPRDRKSPGNPVLGLQHGAGEIQGLASQAAICNYLSSEQWVIWCDLNVEQDALEKAFGDLAFSVRGSDPSEEKESRLMRWLAGERPVIISKPSIMGFGINMQCAHNMAFVGVTDSYEAFYQAVRRCWRFGQTRPVHVHIYASQLEGAIVANLKRKEADAAAMAESLSAETRDAVIESVRGSVRMTNPYNANARVKAPAWLNEVNA